MITVLASIEKTQSVGGIYACPAASKNPQEPETEVDGNACLAGLDVHKIKPGVFVNGHTNRDIEILTYVIDGILEYREDSTAKRNMLMGGEVQIIAAGDGFGSSAGNASHSESLHIIQAWINPTETAAIARGYQQRYFSDDARLDQLCLIASADGRDGSLVLSQDINVYASLLRQEDPVLFQRQEKRALWLQVARGQLRVNKTELNVGDVAKISGADDTGVRFQSNGETEFLLIDLPGQGQ